MNKDDANFGFRRVAIIGVGLLGGSAGLAIKAWRPGTVIAGAGRRRSSLDTAMATGAIDSAHLDATEAAKGADLVILATPVGAFEGHLAAIARVIQDDAVVTDVGSTKAEVVAMAEKILGSDGPFVGSHPMAGSERKGPAFARGDLFEGATCVITPTTSTRDDLVKRVEGLWQAIGMRTVRMAPDAHDRATARVSHLPHALASILMTLPEPTDLQVAATGFRDATRLAGGDPEMWRDIFLTNKQGVLDALDRLGSSLSKFRSLVETSDAGGIEQFLSEAKARRDNTISKEIHDRREAFE